MTELRVRDATEADLPAVLTVRSRSFGPLPPGDDGWVNRVVAEVLPHRMLVVVDDADTVLASGRVRPSVQAWGGRHQPMGGVAGIYVEPSARGLGVASLLMRGLITRMSELGDAVSCLYPTVPALYRGVGYEVGGVQPRYAYAAHALRDLRPLGGGLRPRPAVPTDAELLHHVVRSHQAGHAVNGPTLTSVEAWRRLLGEDRVMCYVLDGKQDGATGFVVYTLVDDVLAVEDLVAERLDAAAALWSTVGSGSSTAPVVRAHLDPRDPVQLVLASSPRTAVSQHVWMLRVIDLARAVAARGFSPHVTASTELVVDDPDAPTNTGHWRVDLADGVGNVSRIDSSPLIGGGSAAYDHASGPVRLGPRGLAALWAGWSLSRLRQAGLAAGGTPEGDAALDAIFAGQPYMTEYF